MKERYNSLIESLSDVLNEQASTLTLEKSVKGTSYDYEKNVTVPAGEYSVLGPDARNDSRIILLNKKNKELYAASKKLVK
jgi:hypothetical protein